MLWPKPRQNYEHSPPFIFVLCEKLVPSLSKDLLRTLTQLETKLFTCFQIL